MPKINWKKVIFVSASVILVVMMWCGAALVVWGTYHLILGGN